MGMSLSLPLGIILLAAEPFQPYEGQPGKDVVWVPTPPALVEKMLDMVKVTPRDFVIDLGSGDGRNVIAAAKRGAHALGVEYDADMVALSRKKAEEAGVADKAKFLQGDMYEADVSQATALVLFLLPVNLEKLRAKFLFPLRVTREKRRAKFLQLPAGTRIVNNGYRIPGWEEAETARLGGDCVTGGHAYLYLVPAKGSGELTLPAAERPL